MTSQLWRGSPKPVHSDLSSRGVGIVAPRPALWSDRIQHRTIRGLLDGVVDRRRVGGAAGRIVWSIAVEFGGELILEPEGDLAGAPLGARIHRLGRDRAGEDAVDKDKGLVAERAAHAVVSRESRNQRLAPATLIGEEEVPALGDECVVLGRLRGSCPLGAERTRVAIDRWGLGDVHAGRVPRGEVAVEPTVPLRS